MLTRRRRSMAVQEPTSNRPDDEADVGILNIAVAAGASASLGDDDDDDNDDDNDDDVTRDLSEDEPPTLYDVHMGLKYALLSWAGSCCASDRADGTTTTPALPTTLGLRIDRVGDLPLPLSDFHARVLKSNRNSSEIEEDSYHRVHSVASKRIHIHNPAWEKARIQLVRTVAHKLGLSPDCLSAELDMLLFMEKGSRIDRCSIVSKGGTFLGTLFVQLPSVFTGGKVSVFVGGEDSDGEEREETTTNFDLGVSSGDAAFSCYFVCHYNDCEFEISQIRSGSRVLLKYSLHCKVGPKPTANSLINGMSPLKRSLGDLPPADRLLLIPMAKEYTAFSLSNKGVNSLANYHRESFEAIKAATGNGWKIRIVTAELKLMFQTGYYGDIHFLGRDSSVLQIFDEEGNDITTEEEWLRAIVDFQSVSDSMNGMVLADADDDYADIWGKCVRRSTTREYREDATAKHLFRASFILAYDSSFADIELKCLGGCEGVAEVTEKVAKTRNYCMLERLLAVVEAKEKSRFDAKSCRTLITMLTKSTRKNAQISNRFTLVGSIFSGLSSSLEPDLKLYDALLAAIARFGHHHFTDVISKFLSDERRKGHHTLLIFLQRADFVLKLNERFENESGYVGKLVAYFTSFGADSYHPHSDEVVRTITSLISQHGWEAMGPIVQATLDFMHRKSSSNRSIATFCNRTILLWQVLANRYDFMQVCFTHFAEDFSMYLVNVTKRELENYDNQRTLVKALSYVMAHGNTDDHGRLGKWAILSEELFTAFLAAVSSQSTSLEFQTQSFLLDVLNKCLVHNSIARPWAWSSLVHPIINGNQTLPPSLLLRRILIEFPDLPILEDVYNRLTLHHASDSNTASYENVMTVFEANPKAASVRDPVTNLYPFMLAASADNTNAAFTLLIANPTLVIGDGRKRKRSLLEDTD